MNKDSEHAAVCPEDVATVATSRARCEWLLHSTGLSTNLIRETSIHSAHDFKEKKTVTMTVSGGHSLNDESECVVNGQNIEL